MTEMKMGQEACGLKEKEKRKKREGRVRGKKEEKVK